MDGKTVKVGYIEEDICHYKKKEKIKIHNKITKHKIL